MLLKQVCENCSFQDKCLAKNKLKPFTEEARTDLGVVLQFISCDGYDAIDKDYNPNKED